jgi:hypothetical protein
MYHHFYPQGWDLLFGNLVTDTIVQLFFCFTMCFNKLNMDCMTSGSTHGHITKQNTIITAAPNIVLNLSLLEIHH